MAEPAQIFQSSRDINHRVLKDWAPSPFSSPKKRSRYDYEAECVLEEGDEEESMEIDTTAEGVDLHTPLGDHSQRPIKPLRRTLFADASKTHKTLISHTQILHLLHESPQLENPFIE